MKKYLIPFLRILAALILIQSLFFKFSGAEESIAIFTTLGLEPYGRIGIGIVELIASVLILMPKTIWLGAALTLGVISGAIVSHLTKLGIEVNGDGGYLFTLALLTFISASIVLWNYRKNIPIIGSKL
jgi:putative oxidoreductase